MSEFPDIWFPASQRRVTVTTTAGEVYHFELDSWDRGCLVILDCADPEIRAELLKKGGLEAKRQKWWLRPGTFNLSNGGQLDDSIHHHHWDQLDGTTHHNTSHVDENGIDQRHYWHVDGVVDCESPACQAVFVSDWNRAHPQQTGSYPIPPSTDYPPVAGPTEAQRPISLAEYSVIFTRQQDLNRGGRDIESQNERDAAIASAVAKAMAEAMADRLREKSATRSKR